MQKTLAQIEQAEQAVRERAWRYGRLINEQTMLTKTIARLQTQVIDVGNLQRIADLAATVSPTLISRGAKVEGVLVSHGGAMVRDVLLQLTTQAIETAQTKNELAVAELADLRKQLASVQAALLDFQE